MDPETTEEEQRTTDDKAMDALVETVVSGALKKLNERMKGKPEDEKPGIGSALVDELARKLQTQAARTDLPEQVNMRRAIEAAHEPEGDIPAAYRSPITTIPAQLSDHRYRRLPEWQTARGPNGEAPLRGPDQDHLVQRWFRALAQKDVFAIREMLEEDKRVRAILLIGDSAAGAPFDGSVGALVPLPVANVIEAALYRSARMRQYVRIHTAGPGQTSLRIPKQSAVASSAWKAENAVLVDGQGAAADNLNLNLQKLTNFGVQSNEAIEDTFGLIEWMISDVGLEMAQTEDSAIYSTGTGGSNEQPSGLELHDTTTASAPAYHIPNPQQISADFTTIGTPTLATIEDMYFALPEGERANAIWSGPDQVLKAVGRIVDGDDRSIVVAGGSPAGVLGDAIAGAQNRFILGHPVVSLPGKEGTPATAPTQDENRLYFWNPRRTVAILEKGDIRMDVSTDSAFGKDNTEFRFVRRVDSGVLGNGIAGRFQYVYTGMIIST